MLNKKQVQNINKILHKQIVQRFGVLAMALLVVGSVAYFGAHQGQTSHASGLGTLSVSPASGTQTQGKNVNVTLYEDSGTDPVNAVQASLNYDPTQLQFVSLAEGTAFPNIAATSTATPGLIRVGRGTLAGTSVSGSNAIVVLTFKVLGSSGSTSLAFDPAFSFIVRSTDNVNILTSTSGASYTLKLPAPTLSSVSPTSGPTAGGTTVTVTGTNFVSGATVNVGGTLASNVSFVSSTSLVATFPSHAAGAVNVVVTNPDGQTATLSGGYTYIAPAPTVSSLAPTSGTTKGGTSVTVTGANFVSGATVTFDTTVMTGVNVVFNSATSLTVTTPSHAAGAVTVTVTNPDGQTGTLAGVFTYIAPAPTISSVTPTSGTTAGGTTLSISGADFGTVTNVTVGGIAATSIVTVSSTLVTAVTPAHAAGLVSVAVTNTSGTTTKASAFTYIAPPPSLSAVNPTGGTASGGVIVTITGANFAQGATVMIGGTPATNVGFISSGTLTATAPAHAAGAADVTVTNPDGQTGSLAAAYTYYALGDANNDGRVNAIDLSILISHDSQNYPPADFNGDGTVGSADMAILLGRWTW